MQVSHAAAEQREGRSGNLGQIETERDFALKPRLHCVAVGRGHVDGIAARQRSNVQIGNFAELWQSFIANP